MREHPHDFTPFLAGGGEEGGREGGKEGGLEAYVQRVEGTAEWGGELEIRALVRREGGRKRGKERWPGGIADIIVCLLICPHPLLPVLCIHSCPVPRLPKAHPRVCGGAACVHDGGERIPRRGSPPPILPPTVLCPGGALQQCRARGGREGGVEGDRTKLIMRGTRCHEARLCRRLSSFTAISSRFVLSTVKYTGGRYPLPRTLAPATRPLSGKREPHTEEEAGEEVGERGGED